MIASTVVKKYKDLLEGGQQEKRRKKMFPKLQGKQKTKFTTLLGKTVACLTPLVETIDKTCIVCFENTKNATFIHGRTGHTCCCLMCAENIYENDFPCPICCEPIDMVIQNFDS